MSKTIRVGNTRDGKAWEAKNRRPYHNTERGFARRETNRAARRQTRFALTNAVDFDDVVTPRPPATSGWMS